MGVLTEHKQLFFIAEFFYASGAVAIKCSIAVTLLRIAASRGHFVYSIWAVMIATVLSAIIFMIGVANICHPSLHYGAKPQRALAISS